MRRKILFVHRWTGLLLALYAVAIGLSGAVLVYREELAVWVRPQANGGVLKAPYLTAADEVVEVARRALPGFLPLSVTWPYPNSPHFHAYCIQGREARLVYVDAQSGKLAAVVDPRADWLGTLDALHANLLLGRTGRQMNGWAAIFTMLLSITGIYLWWPSRDQWRQWLRWRGRKTWWRLFWDLHHAAGVALFAVLLVIAFTGAYFTWSALYVRTVSAVFPRTVEPKLPAVPGEIINPSMAELAMMAERSLPGPVVHRMPVLGKRNRTVAITLRDGAAGEFHLVSTVYLDPRSGETLHVKRLAERPAGDGILGYLAAVHFGVFAGAAGRLLWCLAGLGQAALAITGVLLWWRRLRGIQMGK